MIIATVRINTQTHYKHLSLCYTAYRLVSHTPCWQTQSLGKPFFAWDAILMMPASNIVQSVRQCGPVYLKGCFFMCFAVLTCFSWPLVKLSLPLSLSFVIFGSSHFLAFISHSLRLLWHFAPQNDSLTACNSQILSCVTSVAAPPSPCVTGPILRWRSSNGIHLPGKVLSGWEVPGWMCLMVTAKVRQWAKASFTSILKHCSLIINIFKVHRRLFWS